MSPSLELVQITKIKQTLQLVEESRIKLKENLAEIRKISNQLREENEKLNQRIADIQTQGNVQQLEELKKQVDYLQEQNYKKLSEINEMKRRVKQVAFFGSREIYKAIGEERSYPLDRQKNKISELEKSLEELREKEAVNLRQINELRQKNREVQLNYDNISGAYERVRKERETLEVELKRAGPEAEEESLIRLVREIGVNRLADLLMDNPSESGLENEKQKLAERVLDYFRKCQLSVSQPAKRQVSIREQEIVNVYELSEPFEVDAIYNITTAGFSLGDRLIIKPRIKKCEG